MDNRAWTSFSLLPLTIQVASLTLPTYYNSILSRVSTKTEQNSVSKHLAPNTSTSSYVWGRSKNMFYLLVVAALGEELGSREGPGEESQRAATLVRHGERHVHGHKHTRMAQLQNRRTDKTAGSRGSRWAGPAWAHSAHVRLYVTFAS